MTDFLHDEAPPSVRPLPDLPAVTQSDNCPATTRITPTYSLDSYGVQCKYKRGHDGDHAGYPGYWPNHGDVFWPQGDPS